MTLRSRFTDQHYLREEQYRDSGNLGARAALHTSFSVNHEGWHHWVFERLALAASSRILELGCGPGMLWTENARRLSSDWRLCLSDYSPGMVREARVNLRAAAPAIPVLSANLDAQVLPFADGVFDCVVANHMLYHVPDRTRAYAEVRRVLQAGGRFIAATNGAGHMRELDDLIREASSGDAESEAQLAALRQMAPSFHLENGAAELAPYFEYVQRDDYPDARLITEAEPLVAYILSMGIGPLIDRERLTDAIKRRLAADGSIRISKESGLFSCA